MIIEMSKASADMIERAASLAFENKAFMRHAFENCTRKDEVFNSLMESKSQWNIMVSERPLALFSMHISDTNAALDQFCLGSEHSLRAVVQDIQNYLKARKVQSFTLDTPEELISAMTECGATVHKSLTWFVRRVSVTEFMPILPVANPTPKDTHLLSKLIFESYDKTGLRLSDVASAERIVKDIWTGLRGTFLANSSYVSFAGDKIVSGCLITSNGPEAARIMELFTHPLYRARGLATAEVCTCMNHLSKDNVSTLGVSVSEDNEVAKRLFAKLDFRAILKHTRMVIAVP